jgi:predicted nucleotidyltransferase
LTGRTPEPDNPRETAGKTGPVCAMSVDDPIIRCLSSHPEIRLAILFGSVAAGRDTPASDIDLAVAGSHPLSADERLHLIGDIAQETGRAVDLVDLATATGSILGRILASGRLVHARDRALYAELIRRAIYDDADMAPYRDRIHAAQRRRWIAA